MRPVLHLLAVALLLGIWAFTWRAIYGPPPLPACIPVHFDAAGNPNGWGSAAALWVLPAITTFLYGLMTLVAQFPSAFNFPARVTPRNRPRLEALALSMIAWLRLESICLAGSIQYFTVRLAREGRGSLPPAYLPAAMTAVFLTIGWHVVAMRRVAAQR